jgi:hypothetical protein
MQRIWHKVRKVEIREHDNGIVEIHRLPLLLTTPLLLVAGQIIFVAVMNATEIPNFFFAGLIAFSVVGPFLILSFVFAIEIEIRGGQVIFGAWPFYVRRIAIGDVESWHALTLHPPGNDVHWYGRGQGFPELGYYGYASMVPDTHGVELSLLDGRHVFIATAHPERLMHAIANAKFGATV